MYGYFSPCCLKYRFVQVISFDVKPANVLLDRTGKGAKLADVGLAKVLEHSQTVTNMVRSLRRLVYSKAVAYFRSHAL